MRGCEGGVRGCKGGARGRSACGRGKPLSVQSSAWSLKVASTLAEREPVKVRTPLSGEYGLHMKRLPLACLSPRL